MGNTTLVANINQGAACGELFSLQRELNGSVMVLLLNRLGKGRPHQNAVRPGLVGDSVSCVLGHEPILWTGGSSSGLVKTEGVA
jgi:hypothetical protein